MEYVVSRLNPECVCSLNGCLNEINEHNVNIGCLNRYLMLDENDDPLVFKSIEEAQESLSVHIDEESLINQLKDKTISIDPYENQKSEDWESVYGKQ